MIVNQFLQYGVHTGAVAVFLNEINMVYLVNLSTIVNILSNFTPHAESFDVDNFVMKFIVTDSHGAFSAFSCVTSSYFLSL